MQSFRTGIVKTGPKLRQGSCELAGMFAHKNLSQARESLSARKLSHISLGYPPLNPKGLLPILRNPDADRFGLEHRFRAVFARQAARKSGNTDMFGKILNSCSTRTNLHPIKTLNEMPPDFRRD